MTAFENDVTQDEETEDCTVDREALRLEEGPAALEEPENKASQASSNLASA